jgi:hypothetical protein
VDVLDSSSARQQQLRTVAWGGAWDGNSSASWPNPAVTALVIMKCRVHSDYEVQSTFGLWSRIQLVLRT